MKTVFNKNKSKRKTLFTFLTAVIIISTVALNFLLTYLSTKETLFLDMTPENLYTPSKAFIKECSFIDELNKTGENSAELKIIFCNDPDYLISNTQTRATYFTALRLADVYKNLHVETVNVKTNPTAVSMYKTTSLSVINQNDIIVAYGDRYRIMSAAKMWTQRSDGGLFSYNGEYRLVGLLKSVTAIDMPSAYFVIDHGETYYDPENPESEMSLSLEQFSKLLTARGLQIKLLELSKVDKIPDDCALLIINNPTQDFTVDESRLDEYSYVTDTEKIDRYLVKNQGAVIVNKDYEVTLPVFEDFLFEWGFKFSNTIVKDDVSSLDDEENTNEQLIAEYSKDENSYGYAIYGDFSDLSSAPVTIFKNSGYIQCSFLSGATSVGEPGTPNAHKNYGSFLTSSKNAVAYGKNEITGEYNAPATDKTAFDLASITVRSEIDNYTNEMTYSYFFCTASDEFLSNDLLENSSFANYDVLSALINNISRIDKYGSMEIGGTSLNSETYGGKQLVSTTMSSEGYNVYSPDGKDLVKHNYGLSNTAKTIYTVIVFIPPVALGIYGFIIMLRRRFL